MNSIQKLIFKTLLIVALSIIIYNLFSKKYFIKEIIDIIPIKIDNLEHPKKQLNQSIIKYAGFTISYNYKYKQSNWVAYELKSVHLIKLVKRKNKFTPDPYLMGLTASDKDYKKTGYDRGHLAPASDMSYSNETMKESFYYSNISPQNPSFNRGIWKRCEEQVRNWIQDDQPLYIVTGPILTKNLNVIGNNRVSIPKYFYKVVLDYSIPDIKSIAFLIPNIRSNEKLSNYAISIDSLESLTNIDFFYKLPDYQEEVIEKNIEIDKWNWKIK